VQPQTLDPKSIEAMGMESWELSRVASEIVQVFVANIEGSWRNLVDDLAIHPTKTVPPPSHAPGALGTGKASPCRAR
jgi:hypothetical protein